MIITVDLPRFRDAFRITRPDNFSYDGVTVLFEYLEELEEATDHPIELDVIALCCDFSEFENFDELQENYPDIEDMDDLQDHTTVIDIDGDSFIIQNF